MDFGLKLTIVEVDEVDRWSRVESLLQVQVESIDLVGKKIAGDRSFSPTRSISGSRM